MLVRFTVKNFLSFENEQVFSMIPGRVTSHSERLKEIDNKQLSLLKFGALYGANASGKSNLVRAFKTSRAMILKGLEEMPDNEWHFKLDPKNKNNPTKFEYEIKLADKIYAYGLELIIHERKVIKEWLYELNDSGDTLIFARSIGNKDEDSKEVFNKDRLDIQNEEDYNNFEFLLKRVNSIEETTLISEIARGKAELLKKYRIIGLLDEWLKKKLIILDPKRSYPSSWTMYDNPDFMIELLKKLDTGITGVQYREKSLEKAFNFIPDEVSKKIIEKMNEDLKTADDEILISFSDSIGVVQLDEEGSKIFNEILFTHHNRDGAVFTFGEESDGTKRIFQLMGMFNDLEKNQTIIIDELDRSLHPKLTVEFIKQFLKMSADELTSTQLIITTHESNLMDLDVLRRDEIWFAERNRSKGNTELFSLEEFKVHRSKKIEKDYLFGRYGAVPVFTQCNLYERDKDE